MPPGLGSCCCGNPTMLCDVNINVLITYVSILRTAEEYLQDGVMIGQQHGRASGTTNNTS